MEWVAAIGPGEIILALTPAINLVIAAAVWKWTGRTKEQIEGQSGQIHRAKEEIRGDLRNGIAETLKQVNSKVDAVSEQVNGEVIPRLDRKRERLERIEAAVDELKGQE